MEQQLLLIQRQLAALQGPGTVPQQFASTSQSNARGLSAMEIQAQQAGLVQTSSAGVENLQTEIGPDPEQKPKPQLVANDPPSKRLSKRQASYIDQFIKRYSARTAKSKHFSQKYRKNLADPRAVATFSTQLKEITYPIVVSSSCGCQLTDIDGNEYIDIVSDFGTNIFGFGAGLVRKAVKKQMKKGLGTGTQSKLTAKAASLFQQLVPCERVAFCNTASDAMLASLRLARAVSGRDRIIIFSGAYHAVFEGEITQTGAEAKLPTAAGIPLSAIENISVLPWDDSESIQRIRAQANEIAAILVEPVQSRNPATQTKTFLQQLRSLTEEIGAALIFDEATSGFRIAPGGAQAYFGVQADMATYGNQITGGMPIGVLAGKRKFMDAIDGGHWSYGDESTPTKGIVAFAGTFNCHPPALAAAIACMKRLLEKGPSLQDTLASKSRQLVDALNQLIKSTAAPLKVARFASILRIDVDSSVPCAEVFYHHLRQRGVHILADQPGFITLAHSSDDLKFIVKAFRNVISDLQATGFFPEPIRRSDPKAPPEPGARLGRDPQGNPTWYVKDSSEPSGYRAIETKE